ncbi:UNVERIFIED_CONTAM: hypothetical protein Slati_4256000 [Sesamum latifolium]|uniref:Aminotransferase-like plant mobile domain-containing protein n=1 Tax=Sesamum latifolium TaxID=2727402 RepID=A0AAW2TBZ6_9LAMI
MVYFKNKSFPSGKRHLIILDDQHQPMEKGTMLVVYAPLIGGRNVSSWARLTNSSYLDGCRCEEKLRLINAYDVVYASLFTYDDNSDIIEAFCEAWCPLTNTLLTSIGELSISLWDLQDLARLPMTGCLYDEVVPSALELTGVDEKGDRFISRSKKYLLYAYHLLQSDDGNQCSSVSINKWMKFWSKKAIKYHPPPSRKEKKIVRPKSTHNPLIDIATHNRWSTAEEA